MRISVEDIPELQQAKDDFGRFATAMAQEVEALRRKLDAIEWTGPDFDEYARERSELNAAILEMSALVQSVGGAVSKAGDGYQQAGVDAAQLFRGGATA